MKPIEDRATMATLDVAPSLANGHRALTLLLQPVALFLQEDVRQQGQRPETQERRGTHQLIVVQTQFFLAIAKKHLDVPALGDMLQQGGGIGLQITGGPIACLRERLLQGPAHNDLLSLGMSYPRSQ